jgi:hypothetical protein
MQWQRKRAVGGEKGWGATTEKESSKKRGKNIPIAQMTAKPSFGHALASSYCGPSLAFLCLPWPETAPRCLRWPLWAFIGRCGPSLVCDSPALACVGSWALVDLCVPSLASTALHWSSLACIGRHGPSLACVGLRRPVLDLK